MGAFDYRYLTENDSIIYISRSIAYCMRDGEEEPYSYVHHGLDLDHNSVIEDVIEEDAFTIFVIYGGEMIHVDH